jgi:serine/threonine-protein kinase
MAAWKRSLEMEPESQLARYYTCGALLVAGKPAEALRTAGDTREPGFRLTCAAMAEHDLGHARESQAALEALVAGYAEGGAYQIAQVHAWRGERDRALEWLGRAAELDAGIFWIKTDPILRKVRDDPRFAELLRKLKLPVD